MFGIRKKKSKHPFCSAIVPAAGTSRRMGGENKLLMEIQGKPVLMHTVQAIDQAQQVDEIIVATQQDLLEDVAALCHRAGLHKPVRVIVGGATRTESVLAAALEADPQSVLLAVHDGARPLVQPEMIDQVIRMAVRTNAAVPAIPVIDTIKVADGEGRVLSTPDRNALFAIQTPQVFQADLLKAALQAALDAGAAVTDDASAVERLGKQVYLTEGDRENVKITTPMDVALAEVIMAGRENRE